MRRDERRLGAKPRRSRKRDAIVVALLIGLLASLDRPVARAQGSDGLEVSEQSIKAAYLVKFAGYVQWPNDDSDPSVPLTIGVLGATSLGDELARVTAGRTVNDRPIRVIRLGARASLDALHVLFIGERERNRLDELLSPARRLPVLTVTESDGALSSGSIVNFTIDRERVRFEISLAAAEQSGLRLNSRLLAVAQRVYRPAE